MVNATLFRAIIATFASIELLYYTNAIKMSHHVPVLSKNLCKVRHAGLGCKESCEFRGCSAHSLFPGPRTHTIAICGHIAVSQPPAFGYDLNGGIV